MKVTALLTTLAAMPMATEQAVSVVVTQGITTTVVLPDWPSASASLSVSESAILSLPTGPGPVSLSTTIQPGGPMSSASLSGVLTSIAPHLTTVNSTGPVTLSYNTTATTAATQTPSTVPTAAAEPLAFDSSMMGLVVFFVLGLYLL